MTEYTTKVGLLDVPEPEGLSLEYQYSRYRRDESRVPDRALRRLIFSGRVAGPSFPVPFPLQADNYNSQQLSADEVQDLGNFEERLSPNQSVLIARNDNDFAQDLRGLITEWADSQGLRIRPEVVFAEEVGFPPKGVDEGEGVSSVEVDDNYTEALLGSAFSGSPTTRQPKEPIWRATEVLSAAAPLTFQRVGVYVEVYTRRLWEDSSYEPQQVFLLTVSGPSPSFAQTLDALHGYDYRFKVRSVYYANVIDPNTGLDLNESDRLSAFFLSRPRIVTTRSITITRPSPPTDLQGTWDFDKSALRLRWTMPVDRLGVIKRLQLFGRSGPLEPYSLIREWDWNDNEVLWPREASEQAPLGKQRRERPVGWFYDPEFQPRSGFVRHYTLVVQTTHGVNSTYSIQVTVRWVNAQTGVVCYLLSRSGAPKPYPNLLLENLQFRKSGVALDLVTLNGSTGQLSVIHDPEVSGVEGIRDYQECEYVVTSVDHETLQKTQQTLR